MKKHLISIVSLMLVATLASACSNKTSNNAVETETSPEPSSVSPISITSSSKIDKDKVNLIAHRGFSAQAPENTKASIELAGKMGYYGCEFDIFPTKDGVWVLMHDDTVDRMTNGEGKVTDLTYDEIKNLKIDSGNNINDYSDLSVCSFDEALDLCKQYNLIPYIEIKEGYSDSIKTLVDMIKNKDLEEKSVIISFDYSCLTDVRNLNTTTPLYYLVEDIKNEDIDKAKQLVNCGIDFQVDNEANTNDKIALIENASLPSCSWTVDSIEQAENLYDNHVYNITTNRITP